MSDPRRLVEYPPRVQRWRFADPPVRRRWFWVAVVSGPVAVAVMVGALVVTIVVESRDAPGLLDDTEVVELVGEQCEQMTATVENLPLTGPPGEQADILREQNSAVRLMVEEIRGLDAAERDRPLDAWLADWDRLIQARESWAVQVAGGRDDVDLEVPRDDDGSEIIERMDAAAVLACEVPTALVEPVIGDSIDT